MADTRRIKDGFVAGTQGAHDPRISIELSSQALNAETRYQRRLEAEHGTALNQMHVARCMLTAMRALVTEEQGGNQIYLGLDDAHRPIPVTVHQIYFDAVERAGPLDNVMRYRLDPGKIQVLLALGEVLKERRILAEDSTPSDVLNYSMLAADHLVREMDRTESRPSIWTGAAMLPLVSLNGESLKTFCSYRVPGIDELLSMKRR